MSHLPFYNFEASIVSMCYDSHRTMLRKACEMLNTMDRYEELCDRLLDKPLKLKPKKDKDAPKGPCSAYILFSNEQRASVKSANPNATTQRIMQLLSEQWRSLSADEKLTFEKKAQEDRFRYQRERIHYNNKLSSGIGLTNARSSHDNEADYLHSAALLPALEAEQLPTKTVPSPDAHYEQKAINDVLTSSLPVLTSVVSKRNRSGKQKYVTQPYVMSESAAYAA